MFIPARISCRRTAKHCVPLAMVLCLLLMLDACSDNSAGLVPGTVTDRFSGTVDVGEADFHTFTVAKSGMVSVTLVSAGPPATVIMGLGIGIPDPSGCAPAPNATVAAPAEANPQLAGTLDAGVYCVNVFDIGNQSVPITYTVTISHP